MVCAVCEVRVSAGVCAVCGKILCDVCGVVCSSCGRPSCAAHSYWNHARQPLCAACQSGNLRRSVQPTAVSERPPAGVSSTSFEALFDMPPDRGDPNVSPAEEAPRKKEINTRALTASASRATPIWVSSVFAGGLGWVLLLPLLPFISSQNVFRGAQPWMSYSIVFLGIGTAVWALNGLLRDDPKKERMLCLIGLVLGILGALAAFLVRMPSAAT